MICKFISTFIILLTLISCGRNSKVLCRNFHQGRFVSHEALGQRVILTRNDTIQIEQNEQTGHFSKSDIKWINDCEYELSNLMEKENSSDSFKPWLPGKIITTKLLEARQNYCVYESKINGVSMKLTDTLWILKD